MTGDRRKNKNTRGDHLYPGTDVVHVEQVLPFLHSTTSELNFYIKMQGRTNHPVYRRMHLSTTVRIRPIHVVFLDHKICIIRVRKMVYIKIR